MKKFGKLACNVRGLGKRLAGDIALWSDVVSKADIKFEQ